MGIHSQVLTRVLSPALTGRLSFRVFILQYIDLMSLYKSVIISPLSDVSFRSRISFLGCQASCLNCRLRLLKDDNL